ncbi:MAG: prenyltransferase/squalene oxidase repeat-containing protein [Pseudomonadota bacterium]
MDGSFKTDFNPIAVELAPAVKRILDIQTDEGAIPWFEDGAWDAWNHTESAMALCAMGEDAAAARAYDYLATHQRPDGAWLGDYGNALPMVDRLYISREPAPAVLDSNFCAYPAVGVAHYLLSTEDEVRVRDWWPMVKRALNFVLTLQRPDGSICWAAEAMGTDEEDALLAGNASILKSLHCGLYLARRMDDPQSAWQAAYDALLQAIRERPERFDRRGQGGRFAMDWYYPVLAGALEPADARARILERWRTFVPDTLGCRCVEDEPWVTTAETAELVLALLTVNERDFAADLFESLVDLRDETGAFWMGWQTEEQIFWPQERPAWTQAAVILAADALAGNSAASQLLIKPIN